MSTTKKFSKQQVQAILDNDRIRQHLIDKGWIDKDGDIVDKKERRRQPRHASPSKQQSTVGSTKKKKTTKKKEEPVRSDSPDSAATDRSKQAKKSPTSARSSSSKHPTGDIENVLLRRAVTPRSFPVGDRCLVTMMYFGAELNVEYDRDWFEPDGDEIVIKQQHCGGENLVVFKGFLQPNDVFSFESARHTDYPFALACYINSNVYNRLSVCCEARCKGFVRIGGRYGVFGIIDVQKERSCRRCRYEQRMNKLLEADGKPAISKNLCPKSTKASRLRSKSPVVRKKTPTVDPSSFSSGTSDDDAEMLRPAPVSDKRATTRRGIRDDRLSDSTNRSTDHSDSDTPVHSRPTSVPVKPARRDSDSDSSSQTAPTVSRLVAKGFGSNAPKKNSSSALESDTETEERPPMGHSSNGAPSGKLNNGNHLVQSRTAPQEIDSDEDTRRIDHHVDDSA